MGQRPREGATRVRETPAPPAAVAEDERPAESHARAVPPASREVVELTSDNYAASVADGVWMLEYYAPCVPDAHVNAHALIAANARPSQDGAAHNGVGGAATARTWRRRGRSSPRKSTPASGWARSTARPMAVREREPQLGSDCQETDHARRVHVRAAVAPDSRNLQSRGRPRLPDDQIVRATRPGPGGSASAPRLNRSNLFAAVRPARWPSSRDGVLGDYKGSRSLQVLTEFANKLIRYVTSWGWMT